MMRFETLTLAPIDRRLIVPELMTAEEIAWLDEYHARVARELSPFLADADRAWLDRATAPLGVSA
jgi:Xaa-Pro aminopeptidase